MHFKQHTGLVLLASVALFGSANAFAQRNRINVPVNPSERVTLQGHVSPRALAGTDQGAVDASLQLPSVTIVLRQSSEQAAALDQLLKDQQDPTSSNYHRWLTPEEYADRFGASASDVAKIKSWLEDNGLTVTAVGRGRNSISFRGTAGQVQDLFGVEIHHFLADGQLHYANTSEPMVPVAFQGVVRAVHGLNDFRFHAPRATVVTRFASGELPKYTGSTGSHYLAPADLATIYNFKPLHDAGIKGAGQKIVVVGQTQIRTSDLTYFRNYFGLPANTPQLVLVPGTTDPGQVSGDIDEASLDLEWAGAVAPEASIIFVYSYDVMDAVQYAIDQNLAPVLSMSYGLCEPETGQADASTLLTWSQQANAQGITWLAASGDSGAADCGIGSRYTGLTVDLPAALPGVTGVGGTTFSESGGTYWNSSNASSTRSSALSYIPEIGWNDSTIGNLSSSGGGASAYFTKPSWQTGTGVPGDSARDVPDIASAASPQHDGYLMYSLGSLSVIGGTSAGAPTLAGALTLINQYLVSSGAQSSAGLGNVNPKLYSLAQTTTGVFHDITTGNNVVTACASSRNCSAKSVGYTASKGYDQVTGLGSVDVYNLASAWGSGTFVSRTASLSLTADSTSITDADAAVVTATVQGSDASTTPTGSVTFSFGSTTLGSATLSGTGAIATASLTVSASLLSVGTATVTAQYSGDGNYSAAAASISIIVQSSYTGPPVITGLTNGASFRQVYAPGMILSVFGQGLSPSVLSATTVPLPLQLAGVSVTINGVNAPLYYVSPTQLNVQVPYETVVGKTATLVVQNNGQTVSTTFMPDAAAPGIFTYNGAPVPSMTAKVGQVITLFVTGAGALSPSIATGAAPASGTAVASLPKPTQAVQVTVDGIISSPLQFSGNPAGLVGVIQINYQVPSNTSIGARPVIVSVGGVASPAATLTVTY